MKELFFALREALLQNQAVVLVSVVSSRGSVPGGIGAQMLVGQKGRICGTIGGGAVEHRAEEMAVQALEQKHSGLQTFALDKGGPQELGMVCGGDVTVFFLPLQPGDEAEAFALRLAACYAEDEAAWLLHRIAPNGGWQLALHTSGQGLVACLASHPGGAPAPALYTPLLGSTPAGTALPNGDLLLAQPLVPAARAVIFGGGHISQQLVPVLAPLGFRCVVFDDRPEFASAALFPAAHRVILGDFARIEDQLALRHEDYVIVVTRGHAADFEVERQVLASPHAYVGVIGSRAKTASVNQRLLQAGIAQSTLDGVYTPIGLAIGAKTPAEIAISIAAQLIQVRATQQ